MQAASMGTTAIMYIAIAGIVLFRAARPQRTSVARMWITAALLMLLAAAAIYGSQQLDPAPWWEIALAIGLGVAAGIPVGVLRGHHTQVSATERPGVMQLGASWATAAIYLGAFGLRALVRTIVPVTTTFGTVVSDGLLVFAIAIVGVTYLMVYRKYEGLAA